MMCQANFSRKGDKIRSGPIRSDVCILAYFCAQGWSGVEQCLMGVQDAQARQVSRATITQRTVFPRDRGEVGKSFDNNGLRRKGNEACGCVTLAVRGKCQREGLWLASGHVVTACPFHTSSRHNHPLRCSSSSLWWCSQCLTVFGDHHWR